ncbi:MAG: dihydroorotase [Muribaculaceae bacterium]|nr:dihydroorotase [Muribaculaceae bacterium]
MSYSTIIINAEIINELSRFIGYVTIIDEFIENVAPGCPSTAELNNADKVIDASGCLLIPGAIDDQVHFRDPGLTHKGDIATESMAAIAGGTTSFMDMPNTNPTTTTIEALNAKYERAAKASMANYSFFIGGTNDNIDTLKQVDFSNNCGVKLFLGSSTGNMLVDNADTIRQIFSEVPAIIAIHSEDESIINANKKIFQERYGDNLPVKFHPLIRSEEACYQCTARAVELADKCNSRLHVLHLSTAKELSLFSNAPINEKKITAEACAPHLWFCDSDYARLNNKIKCNPAIKTAVDRDALRNALKAGKIDIVATDHAPHLLSEKEGNCLKAASGMPIIQYSLLMMLELANQGIFTLEEVVNKTSHAPATLYHIDRRGYIRRGYYADLVIVNKNVTNIVNTNDIISRCGWSPLEGVKFSNSIRSTFVNGSLVYDNRIFNNIYRAKRLRFDN